VISVVCELDYESGESCDRGPHIWSELLTTLPIALDIAYLMTEPTGGL
jgi:hypothetical protein